MIRVFPRKTKWTPTDSLAFIGDPPLFRPPEQPVKISVTFTWDKKEGERLLRSWADYYSDVDLGGPAFEDPGAEFIPGRFIKKGVTISSRGCPKTCPYCYVPKREGKIREYKIKPGWILQDNNILACSKSHQRAVFEMLASQKEQIQFNGGLDSQFLKPWHIKEFEKLKVKHFWFSCDESESMPYLEKVADLMADYKQWQKRCYVLIGFNGEHILGAEKRLNAVYEMGFLPFAQLYQDDKKRLWSKDWDKLQRKWCRPAAYRSKKNL
jgi:hypothetical protein